jgi:membrane associated rhomboid family serine protease
MREPSRPPAFAVPDPDPGEAAIRAPSKRLAFDYSLVLLSQGIESTVLAGEDGWRLALRPEDYDRARSVLVQYRRENRGWAWRERLLETGAGFHWGVLLWCCLLLFFHGWADSGGPGLIAQGQMSNAGVKAGEWWRLFTAMTLHADVAHLAGNVVGGFLTLGFAMSRWGGGVGLLAAAWAGILGNGLDLVLYPDAHRSLGASGMVMGGLGLLAVPSLQSLAADPGKRRAVVRGLFAGVLLFVLLGLNPASDVVAHTGGFVGGLLFGLGLSWLPPRFIRHPATQPACVVLLGAIVVLTWMLACRS